MEYQNGLLEFGIANAHSVVVVLIAIAYVARSVIDHLDSTREERGIRNENDKFLDSGTIEIRGPITRENATEYMARMLYFKKFREGKTLTVTIETEGGELTSIFAMCEAMSGIRIPIATELKLGSFAGILIACSGTRGLRTTNVGKYAIYDRGLSNNQGHPLEGRPEFVNWHVSEILSRNAKDTDCSPIRPDDIEGTFIGDDLIKMGLVDRLIEK